MLKNNRLPQRNCRSRSRVWACPPGVRNWLGARLEPKKQGYKSGNEYLHGSWDRFLAGVYIQETTARLMQFGTRVSIRWYFRAFISMRMVTFTPVIAIRPSFTMENISVTGNGFAESPRLNRSPGPLPVSRSYWKGGGTTNLPIRTILSGIARVAIRNPGRLFQ